MNEQHKPDTLEPHKLYSLREAAAVLNIPLKRIEVMARKRILPTVRQSCKVVKVEGVVLITLLREVVIPLLEGRTPEYLWARKA